MQVVTSKPTRASNADMRNGPEPVDAAFTSGKLLKLHAYLYPNPKTIASEICGKILNHVRDDAKCVDYADPQQMSSHLRLLEQFIEKVQEEKFYSVTFEMCNEDLVKEVDKVLTVYKAEKRASIIISPVGEWAIRPDIGDSYEHIHDPDILHLLECKLMFKALKPDSHEDVRPMFSLVEELLKAEHFVTRLDFIEAGGDATPFAQYDVDADLMDMCTTETTATEVDISHHGTSNAPGLFPVSEPR
ncbi:hypothetical protein TWF696_000257 [Orbilia brochopaga]|uniref:Uncharacterized protein n=1 Tax=Orbilia brochopaga TaxID=3140254 RepID=A0AAV9VAV5_9PEZI